MMWKSTTGLVTVELIFMRLVTVWGLLSSPSTFNVKASQSHFPWRQPHACWSASAPFAWHRCHWLGHSRRSRMWSRRGDLPEETLRELEELEQRVKSVEEEYWQSLDPDEAAIERKCAMGLACLQIGMLERAAEEYTAAADSRPPDARSWPLGLVLFYLGRYDEAIARLETDIQYFEDRFDESATDERIWQAAARIQVARAVGKDTARVAKGLPPLVKTEPNALRRTIYGMFRLEASPQEVQNIAKVATESLDHLGVDFFSKMFLGLWHDAHGNEAEAKSYILAACCNQYPRSDDLWFHTPRIHARARGWELSEQQ